MKRIFLTLAMTLIAAAFVFGQSKDEQEIRKMFAATAEAIAKNDVAALSNYYADDLTFTVADGRIVNKTQFLDFVKTSKRESFNFRRCERSLVRKHGGRQFHTDFDKY